VSDNDVIAEFVRISASRIKQTVDQFVSSTEGLPTDLRIEALESLTAQAMATIRSIQEIAEQLKSEAAGNDGNKEAYSGATHTSE
jgi:signal-transduction protein with cAMP-binding, CBS, and nucleotidyltransferase domain